MRCHRTRQHSPSRECSSARRRVLCEEQSPVGGMSPRTPAQGCVDERYHTGGSPKPNIFPMLAPPGMLWSPLLTLSSRPRRASIAACIVVALQLNCWRPQCGGPTKRVPREKVSFIHQEGSQSTDIYISEIFRKVLISPELTHLFDQLLS
jgi:hypothetical protein